MPRMAAARLAAQLSDLPEVPGHAPWPGHEYVRGWGVFGLPFDSGHVLALRVFPENDFGPYRTVWHRDPAGRWSIHVDGPRLDTACPRYYGPACHYTGHARIRLAWQGPATLRVTMDSPALEWTLVRARERLASALGLGQLRLTGTMPSGHTGTLMPTQMYYIDESQATLNGADLGQPVRLQVTPAIGEVTLPARGILATGQAMWQILDPAEYERTRSARSGCGSAAALNDIE